LNPNKIYIHSDSAKAMHAIIVSKKDLAGMNIKGCLLKNFRFLEDGKFNGEAVYSFGNARLYTIAEDTIHYERCEEEINAENYIFATRHQSKSGEKTLSVHFPGNFDKSQYGGKDKELCYTNPILLKRAFQDLNALGKDSGYSITLEATHHGPLIRKPVLFIEIGSKEEEWKDSLAGEVIARTIMKALTESGDRKYDVALGFGGTHYCAAFNRIESGTEVAMGHICPKHSIGHLDEKMIQMMLASAARIDYALLDWKGMDADGRKKVTLLLEKQGIPWKKVKDV
jgi:D-aminoacyl-tRNA deacylase